MKHFLFLILVAAATNAHAQQCNKFDDLLKNGDAYLKGKKPNYQEAINAYTAAILACSDRAGEAQKRIAKMVNDINQLKENALMAERKATEAQKETQAALARSDSLYEVADAERKRATAAEETARTEAENTKKALADLEIQKARTDSALAKAEKLINAFYFYSGRFALAIKEQGRSNKFYFIDKNGDPVEKLGKYDKAEQFDWKGFAKVTNYNKEYLLDTFGHTYRVTYNLEGLNKNIIALELWDKNLDRFPTGILSHPQLEVLILGWEYPKEYKLVLPSVIGQLSRLKLLHLVCTQLRTLPAEIGQLKNLQSLNLVVNELTTLPVEIGQLVNLQSLNLGFNQLTSLPKEIGYLKSLQLLDIRINQLSALPAEIGQLKNLRSLDLHDNNFSMLPAEIRNLKSLKRLDLYENPFPSEYIEQLRKDMPWCEIRF